MHKARLLMLSLISFSIMFGSMLGQIDNALIYTVDAAQMQPQDDKWVQKADMNVDRSHFASCVIDGKIYVMGGASGNNAFDISTVEEYDPNTNKWTLKASMNSTRGHFIAGVVNGKIYAIGDSLLSGSHVEEYDPKNDTWVNKSVMPRLRGSIGGTVYNNKIYVFGGGDALMNPFAFIDVYDPITDTWEIKNNMPIKTWGPAVCPLNEKIYVMGGYDGKLTLYDTVWEYNPKEDTWEKMNNMNIPKTGFTANILNGKIYTIGGDVPFPFVGSGIGSSSVEVYNPKTNIWKRIDDIPKGLMYHSSVVLNNKIILLGGVDIWPHTLKTVYEFTPRDPFISVSPQDKLSSTWGNIKSIR